MTKQEERMELRLTTWDRMTLLGLCNEVPSSGLRMLRMGLKFTDVMELDEEERRAVKFVDGPQGGGSWSNEKHEFDVVLEGDALRYYKTTLVRVLKRHKWQQSLARFVLALYEKLGVEQKEDVVE